MKILLTGASSFTGHWFANYLAKKGHQVFATYTRDNAEAYEGMAKERVKISSKLITPVWASKFGDKRFMDLLIEEHFDVLCHHAADVTNYKSEAFDVSAALENNTHNIYNIFKTLKSTGCRAVVLTGSVFEKNEGAGTMPLKAFNPYGLSKSLTSDVFSYYSASFGIKLGKFVIPNPFGPYEEPRFTTYLIKNWVQDKTPGVNTPAYVRDNIHISLLAATYVDFVERIKTEDMAYQKINPSGYAESQGMFTQRFSDAIKNRTDLKCNFELGHQTEFPEPEIRINTSLATGICDWNEDDAWKELIAFYKEYYF
jgi:nucleoside-diphosphate-sugar epimerase